MKFTITFDQSAVEILDTINESLSRRDTLINRLNELIGECNGTATMRDEVHLEIKFPRKGADDPVRLRKVQGVIGDFCRDYFDKMETYANVLRAMGAAT